MKVYCVFMMYGDGDHNLTDALKSIHKTVEGAINSISVEDIEKCGSIDLAHKNMHRENNYTYVGTREDISGFEAACGFFHGFIIEEVEVQD